MAREISAGGVVVRHTRRGWMMAAIQPRRDNDNPGKIVLARPKGSVDPGETPEQTARREIREEAGIEVELIAKLDDVRYIYTRTWGDRARVFKIVSFFLFRYRRGELGNIAPEMEIEVSGAEWVPLEEAPLRLSYKGEREMARAALGYLREHPELAGKRPAGASRASARSASKGRSR
jgi:8-oxo-dGTP pyrophosphatase MutT (NUDIX family)